MVAAFDKSEFLATFRDESNEHIQNLNNGLLKLEKDPENQELIEEMFCEAHTLKGAARMMGFDEIKDIAHEIEEIFGGIVSKKIILTTEISTLFFTSLDSVSVAVEEVVRGDTVSIDTPNIIKSLKDMLAKSLDVTPAEAEEPKKKVDKPSESQEEESKPEEKVSTPLPAEPEAQPPVYDEETPEDYLAPEEAPTIEQVRAELEAQKLKAEKKKKDSPVTTQPKPYAVKQKAKPSAKVEKYELEEYIRVPLHKINKLLNLVGEMVINKIKSAQKISILKLVKPISSILK